jgi:hypothetical protein
MRKETTMKQPRILWMMVGAIFGVILPVQAAELKVPGQYSTIQAAINTASSGDTVLVADGTYTGEGNRDLDFKGKAITVKSQNGAAKCILDCQGSPENPHRGVHFHSSEDDRSILNGLTIQNGYAVTGESGGGLLCDQASPTILNCVITANTQGGTDDSQVSGGGGIACLQGASPVFQDCTISNNNVVVEAQATPIDWGLGGGIYCSTQASPRFIHCTIQENQVSTLSACGGGIYCGSNWNTPGEEARIALENCLITQNTAGGLTDSKETTISKGGGIFLMRGAGTLKKCLISGNQAVGSQEDSSGSGGGIYCFPALASTYGDLRIEHCVISQNSVQANGTGRVAYGGGLYGGNFILTNSIISANSAYGSVWDNGAVIAGGGLYISSIDTRDGAEIRDCTILGNSATITPPEGKDYEEALGGGIYCYWDVGNAFYGTQTGTIRNCTISENSALKGAGIYLRQQDKTILNCTLVANTIGSDSGNGGGLYVGYSGQYEIHLSLVNSLLNQNERIAVYVEKGIPSSLTLKNNLFEANPQGDYCVDGATVYTGADPLNGLPGCQDNLEGDPLWVRGRYGDYYLSQKAAGQSQDSPCVNAGSDTAVNLGFDQMFTRTDGGLDTGLVDLGRHYQTGSTAENYVLKTSVTGGHGTLSPASGFFPSNSVVSLQATPEAHYFVKKWSGTDQDASVAATNTVTMLMDRTVTVELEFGYQIQRRVEGQGSITTGISRTYFTPGEQATLYAVPKEGWMFDHWSGDLSGTSNPISFNVHSDMSVQAIFIKRSALLILKLGEGTISRTPSLSAYPANSRVTLTAVPASGWVFRKWSGDLDSSSPTVMILLDTDKSIQAEFVPDGSQSNRYGLSVFIAGKGSVSPFGGAFTRNSSVTLTATPEKGWRLVRWMGDLEAPTKTTAVTITMDRARTITAVFEEETSGTIVIPNTEEDTDEDPAEDIPAEDTDPAESVPADLLQSCTFPSAILVLTLLAGFVGLGFESRR